MAQWVRLDTNILTNRKMVGLYAAKKWRAALVYNLGLAYCGHGETDGLIPRGALPFIQATTREADELVEAGLWVRLGDDYLVPDWAEYQPTKDNLDQGRANARRAVCDRWMRQGKPCSCGMH